jgi:outer membrane receptor protein involved in Fe transport
MDASQFQPNGKITGILIDSETNTPVEYGNVILFRSRDSVMVNGTVSNKDGSFTFDKILPGKYHINLSYIGYLTKKISDLTVNPSSWNIDLKEIKIEPKSVNMNEIVVQSTKETMQFNLDKKVYNLDANMSNSGGTAVDVLENIPSVQVDADGGVSVRGNSNITVLVDGRPASLAGFSGSDVLAQIPASSIESIELVTNPSARYDPEGTAGIINVILKRKSNLGYSGSVMGNLGSQGRANTSINGSIRDDDYSILAGYDGRFFNTVNGGTSLRTSFLPNSTNILDQNTDGNFKMKNHSVNFGVDYYLQEREFITLSTQLRFGDFDNSSAIINKNYTGVNNLTSYFDRISTSDRNNHSGNYTLSYKKNFENRAKEITADIMYSTSEMDNTSLINQNYYDVGLGMPVQLPSRQNALSSNSQKLVLAQANFIQPLDSWGRLETGLRSQIKDLTSSNKYLDYNSFTNSWGLSSLGDDEYDYKEQVHALYAIYSNGIGNLTGQLGLRAEQVYVDGNSLTKNQSYESEYFDVYPTAHLRYKLNDIDEIQLSYSRRIDRPQNRQLNPYVDRTDSLNISAGNPNLKPQYHNSLELGLTQAFGKTYLISNVFYRQNTNLISTISTLLPNGVTYSTFENVSKGKSYGLEFILTQPVADWLRLNGTLSYYNSSVEDNGTLGGTRSTDSWVSRLNSSFTFSSNFSLQLIFSYSSPTILLSTGGGGMFGGGGRGGGGGMGGGFGGMFFGSSAQTKMQEQYAMDMMARKEFLDGKLTFTLRVTDVFKTRKFNTETIGTGFSITNDRRFDSRMAFLGVSFRIDSKRTQDQNRRDRIEEGLDEL